MNNEDNCSTEEVSKNEQLCLQCQGWGYTRAKIPVLCPICLGLGLLSKLQIAKILGKSN